MISYRAYPEFNLCDVVISPDIVSSSLRSVAHSPRGASRSRRSCRASRARFRRLALSNKWDFFFTITFDGSKVDRYSFADTVGAVQTYFHHLTQVDSAFRYLFVVERHKDGAFHVHGLCAALPRARLHWGRNIKCYYSLNLAKKFGSNRFIALKKATVASHFIQYCVKYMVKELDEHCPSAYYRSRNFGEVSPELVPSSALSVLLRSYDARAAHGRLLGVKVRHFLFENCECFTLPLDFAEAMMSLRPSSVGLPLAFDGCPFPLTSPVQLSLID